MIRSARRGFCFSIAAALAVTALLLVPARGSHWSASGSAASDPPHEGPARPELQRLLDQVVAAGAPGVVALVNDGRHRGRDRAVWQGADGVADLRTRRPMRSEDRYRVGSVTKSFVATVALQLVAEGRLSLSDTVERWLPGLLPYGRSVTVRQLLSHTSGVPDNSMTPSIELLRGNRFRSWQPRELVALVADRPPDFAPGSAWSYSNTGYVLAGMVIERATGNALGRELERRIFRPLQLRDTDFPVNFPFLPWPHARGYSLGLDDEGFPIEGPLLDFTVYDPSLAWAAGNIVSDIDDVARFYRVLLGGRLLAPAQLAAMKTTVQIEPGVAYGLGLFAFDTGCGPIWGHGGAIPGFSNELFSSEDGTRQYGVMMNAEIAPIAVFEPYFQAIDQALADAFIGMPCQVGGPDPTIQSLQRLSPDRPQR
jgi:D-alanyl-D-alanine carboxypeptidase